MFLIECLKLERAHHTDTTNLHQSGTHSIKDLFQRKNSSEHTGIHHYWIEILNSISRRMNNE